MEPIRKLIMESGGHIQLTKEHQHQMETLAQLIIHECVAVCMSQADKRNILYRFGLPVESNVKYPGPEASGSVTSQYTREYNIPK